MEGVHMVLDLYRDVFQPVAARVTERTDSLRSVKHFLNSGIEGWFKVEIVAALGDKVTSIKNVGPDLTLEDGTNIEIKAATNFDKSWCILYPLKKYGTPVLFLADGERPEKFTSGQNDTFEIVGRQIISDGMNNWLLGMVRPKT
jgi:hypothetical protein